MGAPPRPPALRLFAAVELPGSVRVEVDQAAAPLRARYPSLRWTDLGGWHLTLAFLGPVPDARHDAASQALTRAVDGVAPFALSLTGAAGSFRAGVVWAGIAGQPALESLAAAVRRELSGVVAPPGDERPFHPHLTLARATGRAGEPVAAAAAAYRGPRTTWTVGRITLMASRPGSQGARYEIVSAHPLTATKMRDSEQTFG